MARPGLGRLPQFDMRSLGYPIRTLLDTKPLRSYTWRVYCNLNQFDKPECVGFSWAHELAARPVVVPSITNADGTKIYKRAQDLDEYPGENYDGSSVLGGAKAVKELGHIKEYRWAFYEEELARGVGNYGPAVIGIDWWTGMFDPDRDGYLNLTGRVEGGHAILVNGFNVKRGDYTVHNSWGSSWGYKGTARIRRQDMAILLAHQGEACIPIRQKVTTRR